MNIVVLILILLIVCGFPEVSHHTYGYAPSGALVTILLILIVLYLLRII